MEFCKMMLFNRSEIILMANSSKFDIRSRYRVSKRIRKNLATHPFVVISIIAAIAVTVWSIAFLILR
jgi:hypothetical protein